MLPYIINRDTVSVFYNGRTITIDASHSGYADAVEAIKNNDTQALESAVRSALERLTAATAQFAEGSVRVIDGVVTFKGQEIHSSLTERMLEMLDKGFDLVPMARFLERLQANPSYRAVQDLYKFLEVGKMPLTADGCFLAYKAIRADWKDIHSGKFDNSIGAVCEMPRNKVDEDPNRTCSAGLHVCSFDYLPSFAHSNGHVVVVKVDPADVVAIPSDYNNAKMRVCKYVVLQEVEGWYAERADVLGGSTVRDLDGEALDEDESDEDAEDDVDAPVYEVQHFRGNVWHLYDDTDDFGNACVIYEEARGIYRKVRLQKFVGDAEYTLAESGQ